MSHLVHTGMQTFPFLLVQGLKKIALLFPIDEILGYLSSFPHEKETVQLPTLAHAQDIYPPVYHGKLHVTTLYSWERG